MAARKVKAKTPPQKGVVAIVPDQKTTPTKTKSAPKKKSKTPSSPPPRRKSWFGWFFGLAIRLYLLFASYRTYQYISDCPKDGSDERPLCVFGDRVLDTVEPFAYDIYDDYIDPYYTEYLSDYVEKATPYVVLANKQYVQPARIYALEQYDKHGKPLLEKAKGKVLAEYTRVVDPHVKDLTAKGKVYYDDYLADAVTTGNELYVAYYPVVEKHAIQTYGYALEQAYPYYLIALPYILKAWEQGLEAAGWAGVEGKGWIVRRWGMHVEPQIWRIQERLGLKLKHGTPVKDANPTPPHNTNPNASSSDTVPDAKIDTKDTIKEELKAEIKEAVKPVVEGEKKEEPVQVDEEEEKLKKRKISQENIAAARPIVEADLDALITKFEEAGAKAISDVVSKLDTLVIKVMKEQEGPTEDNLKYLDNEIEKQITAFGPYLEDLLASPAEHKYVMIGFDGMMGTLASRITTQKGEVTQHSQNVLMDTYQETAKIVDAALADMDSVLDLGMQELGLKWAWMDGITYKDWAKYHELKKDFAAIKTKVIRAGQSHKKLREITDWTKAVDDGANEVVNEAHKELATLEKIGREKLEAKGRERAEKAEKEKAEKEQAAKETVEQEKAEKEKVEEPVISNPEAAVQEPTAEQETQPEAESETYKPKTRSDGKSDPRPPRPKSVEEEKPATESSPVDEIEQVQIDNKGQVVEENPTNAAPADEQTSVKSEKQSPKEAVAQEADENPIAEPEVIPPQQEKLVEKDEL